ncbi:MAG: hypothetical protein SGI90_13850 [Candidatus Eisenbacteria bacterium]|nr:hypothetical protein [Candidatus Eisenbacteria bacterium]
MFFRLLLDLALVGILALDPDSGATRTAPPMPTLDPVRLTSRPIMSGPRPPKKPPEKRPHDSTWSDIKSHFGGRS